MKSFKQNWLRYLLQWGVLIAIIIFLTKIFGNQTADPEAYCPFGGLQTLATYLTRGSMACSMTMLQIMVGIMLAVGVILFSKLFCGYLCPLGLTAEYLGKGRKKLKIQELTISQGSVADKLLRAVKYVLLFWIFYMTLTSSELFCKNFDPYYAFATGFKGELTVWMALISIVVLFLGSFFINMFWCKYICPLGALSNLFKFTLTFVALVLVYVLLGFTGLSLSWVWLLAAATLIAYLSEVIYMRSKLFPLLKITRNTELCDNCGLCEKRCPYRIPIQKETVVRHIDCTLCTECVAACHCDALQVNKRKFMRWLPAILSVVLFGLALFLGNKWELPTIDERWGDKAKHEQLSVTRIEGLRSVKCFGSSKAFSAQLQKIPGIYGVATFVKHHKVDIYYRADETTAEQIQEAIFVPSSFLIATPPKGVDQLKVITLRVEKMFDKQDPNYLGLLFRQQNKPYYGLETEFACPLIVRLYMDPNEPVDPKFLRSVVESKELRLPAAGGKENIIKCNYELVSIDDQQGSIDRRSFLDSQFKSYKQVYKSHQEKAEGKAQAVYEITGVAFDKPIVSRYLPYLSSHLSQYEAVLSMETLLNEEEQPALRIVFLPDTMTEDQLWEAVTAPVWKVTMKDGSIKEEDAKIGFKGKGVRK